MALESSSLLLRGGLLFGFEDEISDSDTDRPDGRDGNVISALIRCRVIVLLPSLELCIQFGRLFGRHVGRHVTPGHDGSGTILGRHQQPNQPHFA